MPETSMLLLKPMAWGPLEQASLSSKRRRRFAPDARGLLSHEVHMTESRVIPMKQTWIDVRGAQVPWPAKRLTANCWKQRPVRVAVRLSIKMRPRSHFLCSFVIVVLSVTCWLCTGCTFGGSKCQHCNAHSPAIIWSTASTMSHSFPKLSWIAFGLVNPSIFTSGSTTTNKSTRFHRELERITFAGLLCWRYSVLYFQFRLSPLRQHTCLCDILLMLLSFYVWAG